MKSIISKAANFIVNKRFIVLGTMLLITIICGMLIPKVTVNTDMSKYLPDDFSMKQGMDIMKTEFPDRKAAKTIRVMFRDLNNTQKSEVLSQLETIPYVDSVDYEADSEDHNKDGYTLYVVNTDYDYGSPEEKSIESAIKDNFTQYDMTLKNDDTQGELPGWVVGTALLILIIILFAMCASWFEPFLFLITIGIAVVINMGSNIIFDSVSNTTYSIAAILQLVLSMDYSIILMNRYRQELKLTENRAEAMKTALTNAFSSITSSAVTTIVGLLMLVFMSFKIGADLGLVLAKGVTISMLSVFIVLPVLILLFDKLIQKTAKKVLHIPIGRVSSFSFRFRKILAAGFLLLFISAYFLQGITKTAFSLNQDDPIADVFPKSNPIVMLYDNDDDAAVAEIAEQLKENDYVKDIISYSTIMGKPYNSAELTNTIEDMGMDTDMDIEPFMFDILYYDYYTKGKTYPIAASDFLNFIADDVATNETLAKQMGDDIKENIDKIKKFANSADLTRLMNADELANYFGMKPEDVEQLLLFYFTQKDGVSTGTMTLPEFANFIVNDVASNKDYASMFDPSALSQMKMLTTYTDAQKMTAKSSYTELSMLLGMEPEQMKMLFVYYYALSDAYTPNSMTLPAFVQFIRNDAAKNPMFGDRFDKSTLAQMDALAAYADKDVIHKQMTSPELAGMLGMDSTQVSQLFAMYFGGTSDGNTMSPEQFIDYMLSDVVTNPAFSEQFNQETIQQLAFFQTVIKATVSGTAFDYSGLSKMLGMDSNMMKMLYTYHDSYGNTDSWRLSTQTVVNFLVNNSGQVGSMLPGDRLSQLKTAQKLINGSVARTKYTSNELANLVGISTKQTNQLYLLYASKYGDTSSWKLSVQEFVNFINSDVLSNKDFSDKLNAGSASELKTAKTIIDAVVSGKEYTAKELSSIMGGLSDRLSSNSMELMYLYYASTKYSDPNWTLSIKTLFDYLSDDIINDPRFEGIIDDKFRNGIVDMKADMDDAAGQLKGKNYSLLMLNTTLPDESEDTSEFIETFTEKCDEQLTGDYHLIGNSPMGYEMSKGFGREMLLITVLTALSIFAVVAITFRSLLIPLILVLIVQCGVFITIAASGLRGYDIYYLSSIIVQCILMGATVDYGILFTNYFREKRKTMELKEALTAAYNGSIHTIMTSGSIMMFVLGIIGALPCDPSIRTIVQTLSIGTLSATLLILFVLPGLLATFDRLIVKK
jgi:predicted RND superfamily exporter protein